jgi:hypothetical protein
MIRNFIICTFHHIIGVIVSRREREEACSTHGVCGICTIFTPVSFEEGDYLNDLIIDEGILLKRFIKECDVGCIHLA